MRSRSALRLASISSTAWARLTSAGLHIFRYRHEFTFVAHIWTETADGDFNVRTLELTEAARKFEELQRLLKSD